MLKHCTQARCCLILKSVRKFNPACQQLGLAGFDAPVSLDQAIEELVAAKRAGNRREVYLKSLRHYLSRFAAGRGARPLCDIGLVEIESFMAQFTCSYSRQTWLNRISTLFSFAVRRGYIQSNPCDRIERVTVDRKPPFILSPEQVEILLRVVPTLCRPYLILGLFAGIRPDELLQLDWSQVCLETKTVRVNVTKTRRRRIVPLEARAVALLAACPVRRGAIAPSNVTVRRFKRRARTALKLEAWPQDVLRHTAASYLLALHGDVGKVAMRLGNSPGVLLTHYHEPVTAAACARFWSVDQDGH